MQTDWIGNMLILILLGFFTNCETVIPIDSYLPAQKAPVGPTTPDNIGGDYFVSPDGNDDNPGTLQEPWKTWSKAFQNAVAGDTVYFRGGIYYSAADNWGERGFNSGIKENPICFLNYPDETPILDCANKDLDKNNPIRNFGITMTSASNIYIKGLHIRNVYQSVDYSSYGISMTRCENIKLENMVINNIHGTAYTTELSSGTIQYINCDAYVMCNALMTNLPPLGRTPGQNGVGFYFNNYENTEASRNSKVIYEGCRAWEFSDNGFDGNSNGFVEWVSCWAFDGGLLFGEGCGFKYSSAFGSVPRNTLPVARVVKNCIAAMNGGYAFSPNNTGVENMAVHCYNNTAYHNGYKTHEGGLNMGFGFRIMRTTTINPPKGELYANNLAYDNEVADFIIYKGQLIEEENNSWNLPFTVVSDDFISLDWSELKGARKEDGSLPEIDFMKLKDKSQLIDKGVDVGLNYLGKAPDLGAFEIR